MTKGKWNDEELSERRRAILDWWYSFRPLSRDQLVSDVDEYAASEVGMEDILSMFRIEGDRAERSQVEIYSLGFYWRSFIDVECRWYKSQDRE